MPTAEELASLVAPTEVEEPAAADTPQPVEPTEQGTVLTPEKLGGLTIRRVVDRSPYINMLLYGNSGVGKTRLSGSAVEVPELSPVLFVDIEGGLLTLQSCFPQAEYVRVTTWEQMQLVYDNLRRNPERFKTV